MNRLIPIFLVLLILAACKPASPGRVAEPQRVTVQVMAPSVVRDVIELDGVVAPVQQVNLVARVPGALDVIHFKDGAKVRKGQLLFTIEQQTYQAQVQLNEARLAASRSEYQRQVELMKDNATSQASVDSGLSNQQQDQANLRMAKINLEYTEVRAPFSGVMGRRVVDVGNFVGATSGGTVLATLLQISPAYVNASVGERDVLRLRKDMAAAKKPFRNRVGTLVVEARLQNEELSSAIGVLDFIDTQESAGSGTLAVRGRFANDDYHLVPGFYAKLILNLNDERQVLVLPVAAIQSDQEGEFVYVVTSGNLAQRRKVTTLPLPGETREVLVGLKSGERVVVGGYARISDGAAVQVQAAAKGGESS